MPKHNWSVYKDLVEVILREMDSWTDSLLSKEFVLKACMAEIDRRKAEMYAEIMGEDNE